nr:hypothetical protein GCM10025699_09370 [Microbacterium flavescens]
MITFSPDHSAPVGMSVFSGFAIATGLVLLLSVWLVYPAGRRWPAAALGGSTLVAGMVGGLVPLRTVTGFFSVVIAWAVVSGLIELVAGWRAMRGPRARREIAPGVTDARPVIDPGPHSEGATRSWSERSASCWESRSRLCPPATRSPTASRKRA